MLGGSKPYYSRIWCFQLSPIALKFGEATRKPHWKVLEKGMKIHMMSHIKVCSLKTYHIFLVEYGELPTKSLELQIAVASMDRG